MKKLFLVLTSSTLAIILAAFTPDQKKAEQEYFYLDSSGFHPYDGPICEGPGDIICTKPHPEGGGTVTIFTDDVPGAELRYDGN